MTIEMDIIIAATAGLLGLCANVILYFSKDHLKHIHARIDKHQKDTKEITDKLENSINKVGARVDNTEEKISNIKITLTEIKKDVEFIKNYCKRNGLK